MEIKNIFIRYYQTGEFKNSCEGVKHVKTLPYLSIVQSLKGTYEIKLDDGEIFQTSQNGAFIAPSQTIQTIIHHNEPQSNYMHVKYVFLDVVINEIYSFDNLFSLPVLMPEPYLEQLNALLSRICSENNSLCTVLSDIYALLDILFKIARPKRQLSPFVYEISAFVREHFREKITHETIAEALHVSKSSLFRIFKMYFNKSPANYINEMRVAHAAALFEAEKISVQEAAFCVGFEDVFYFSKIFKKILGVSPYAYKTKFNY